MGMITWAKQGTLHARRQARKVMATDVHLKKLFDILGPRYENREGGYTRYLKLQKVRRGDGADMSVIEFVDRGELRPARSPKTMIPSNLEQGKSFDKTNTEIKPTEI